MDVRCCWKCFFVIIAILLLGGIAALLVTTGSSLCSSRQPQSHLIIPGELDFGSFAPSKQAKSINISNPTRRPITITAIVSSCSCTLPDIATPYTVEGGKSVQCRIVFDGQGATGWVRKRIVFHTDDLVQTKDGPKDVAFVTNIVAFVERQRTPSVVPAVVNFGRIGTWESPSAEVEVVNEGSVELRVENLKPVGSNIGLEIVRRKPAATAIRVSLDRAERGGSFVLTQLVETSQGQTQFEIRGERRKGLYLDNDVLVFRRDGNGTLIKTVTIHHKPGIDLSTLRIVARTWTVNVVKTERISSTAATVCINLIEEKSVKGNKRGTMLFSFPDAEFSSEVEFVVVGEGAVQYDKKSVECPFFKRTPVDQMRQSTIEVSRGNWGSSVSPEKVPFVSQ